MIKALQIIAIILSGLLLTAAVGLLLLELTWTGPEPASPRDYFLYGSTGTELMPLAVFQVLPALFPDNFQPAGPAAGDWIDQFGFIRGTPGVNEGMPYGVNISYYQPKSGAPSPIPFVGFNCAVCHTSKVFRSRQDKGVVVLGMANANLDLVAFGDAIKTSVLDKRLTLSAIASAYPAVTHKHLGLGQKLAIALWLRGARKALRADFPLRGSPFGGIDLRNSNLMPSGPGRNEPMKETVRFLIHQTPMPPGGASKIPCLYQQSRRDWAQFDGSLRDPITRNSLAALGVGASVYNLRVPGILNTMRQTYTFVKPLDGPRYSDLVKENEPAIDPVRAGRGRAVYGQYCGECHGWPQQSTWIKGKRQGDVVPGAEIGTDPARLTFRYYSQMGQMVYDFFPKGHPLRPKLEDIRALPPEKRGFITEPLESVSPGPPISTMAACRPWRN